MKKSSHIFRYFFRFLSFSCFFSLEFLLTLKQLKPNDSRCFSTLSVYCIYFSSLCFHAHTTSRMEKKCRKSSENNRWKTYKFAAKRSKMNSNTREKKSVKTSLALSSVNKNEWMKESWWQTKWMKRKLWICFVFFFFFLNLQFLRFLFSFFIISFFFSLLLFVCAGNMLEECFVVHFPQTKHFSFFYFCGSVELSVARQPRNKQQKKDCKT